MFERYTEKARRVIFFSRYEASQFGSTVIDTDHIFLGLLREDKNLFARFLPDRSISVSDIRGRIGQVLGQNEKVSESVDLPLSSRAKKVLNHAAEESMLLQDGYIGTEHLLLGLLREDESITYKILHEVGLNIDLVRERMRQKDRKLFEEDGPKDYLKRQINEIRNLARELLEKAERIEEMLEGLLSGEEQTDKDNREE